MPRPLRIEYPGAWYHVMNRGLGGKNIYDNNKHREKFLQLLADAIEQYKIEIHSYCLMDNHYHLLVHTPHENLSRAMRHINGLYTQYYNRSKKTDGSLFRGRYKAVLIEGDSYLLQVSRYIHLNPMTANMIKRPEAYQWSSYKYYIGSAAQPPWLKIDIILSIVSHDHQNKQYQNFVMAGIDTETKNFYCKKNIPVYFGNEKMKRKRLKNLSSKKIQASVTDYRQLEVLPSLDTVMQCCIKYFRYNLDEISKVQRGRTNVQRVLTMLACRKWTHATLDEISRLFGSISINGVSNAITRTKRKFNYDKKLKKLFDVLDQAIEKYLNTHV